MLRLIKTRVTPTRVYTLYEAEHVGDELPLHSHTFNHLTRVSRGVCEIFDGAGKSAIRTRADAPLEYVAGRMHGIRGMSDGARFLNVAPVL